MIPVPTTVVADHRANVLGDAVHRAYEIVEALGVQLGMLVERAIEIRDVGLMMLAVMNLHGLRVDVWFERVWSVGQGGQRVGHCDQSP